MMVLIIDQASLAIQILEYTYHLKRTYDKKRVVLLPIQIQDCIQINIRYRSHFHLCTTHRRFVDENVSVNTWPNLHRHLEQIFKYKIRVHTML